MTPPQSGQHWRDKRPFMNHQISARTTSGKRLLLAGLALLTGSAVTPFLLLLAAGNAMIVQGLTQMPQFIGVMHQFSTWYTPFILLPSLVVLFLLGRYTKREFPELANRIRVGFVAGALATFALDTFRQLGVIHGWLPMDTVQLFGKMIVGPQSLELAWTSVGMLYHFLNGASFGMFYAIVWGKAHWIWAVVWALVVELGMMTLPPMAPIVGPFGSNTGGPELFVITLIAHIAYGVVLGLLVRHWVKTKGSIFSIQLEKSSSVKR